MKRDQSSRSFKESYMKKDMVEAGGKQGLSMSPSDPMMGNEDGMHSAILGD
jgi:hypothetical protein